MFERLRNPAAASLILALVLRVGWVYYENSRHGGTLEWPDEDLHWQIATNLVEHGEYATDDGRRAARMPLYPLFLTLFSAAGESGVAAARYSQAAISALATPVGVLLAMRGFGKRCGWIAGVLLACDPFSIYFCAKLLTESLFTTVAVILVALAWRRLDILRRVRGIHEVGYFVRLEHSWIEGPLGWAAIGLLAAAAIMLRQSAVAWIAVFFLLLWLAEGPRAKPTAGLLVATAVILLSLLPWGLRNKKLLGDYEWLSANGGVTLYDAQGPQADGSSNQAFLAMMFELYGMSEVEQDRYLGRLALEQMRRDPLRVAKLAAVKFARTWNPLPNVAEYRGGAAAWAGAVYTIVVLLLSAIGVWKSRRGRRRRASQLQDQLWLPVILFTLLHCVYIGSVRYRVPLMPFLAISAAACRMKTSRPQTHAM